MPTLIGLTGLPGTGKTTLAIRFEEERNMVRVSRDDTRDYLMVNKYSSSKEGYVIGVLKNTIMCLIEDGRDVVYDATCLTQADRERVVSWAREPWLRGKLEEQPVILWVYLPPEDVQTLIDRRPEIPEEFIRTSWKRMTRPDILLEPHITEVAVVDHPLNRSLPLPFTVVEPPPDGDDIPF